MFKLVCIPLSLLVLSVKCDSMIVKQSKSGPIEGIERTSSLGQQYYAFRGVKEIPHALFFFAQYIFISIQSE